jgi:hypothetical protein
MRSAPHSSTLPAHPSPAHPRRSSAHSARKGRCQPSSATEHPTGTGASMSPTAASGESRQLSVVGRCSFRARFTPPGGGPCELRPNVTLTGATGAATPAQTNFLTHTGVPSNCGVPKVCPGTTVGSPFPSDNYTFGNGPSVASMTVTMENDSPTVQLLATVYSGSYNSGRPG